MESVKNLKKELKLKDKSFNEIETINIKIKSEEELYSGYNYDRNEVLNPALGDFLLEKAESLPAKSKLRLKFFSDVNIKEHELFSAIKNKFKGEFENYQRKLKKTALFSLVVLILGILFLGLFILEEMFFQTPILSIILEIVSWVFIWEAVDAFFLQRSSLKEKRLQMARIYDAEMEVVNVDFDNIEKWQKLRRFKIWNIK